jgi:hypothetical protein
MASWQQVLNLIGPQGPEGPPGPSGHSGTFTANGTEPVIVSDSNVLSTSTIIITRNTSDIVYTPPAFVCQLTPGTSFTIVNIAADECSYNYRIL